MSTDIDFSPLHKLCPQATLVYQEQIDPKYTSDFLQQEFGYADAYLQVSSTQDVANALKFCYEHKINVVIRGAGTNLVGSTIPQGGLVLDISKLNNIGNIDYINHSIEVEAGVLLSDLQHYVEELGFFYPPDPAEKNATIGGNIATNAGGMRAVKYGVTRDYVLGLEIVNIKGEILTLGGPCHKDATGLNLKQLFIGSEGSLGVITKCILKLIPKPQCCEHILLGFANLSLAIEAVNKIKHATAIEFIERKVLALGEQYCNLSFPLTDCHAFLIVSFDGNKEEVLNNIKACQAQFSPHLVLNHQDLLSTVWTIRSSLAKAIKLSGNWEPVDTVVPLQYISNFVKYIDTLSLKYNIRILAFGHAGDGNVHLCILQDQIKDELWLKLKQEILQDIYQYVYNFKGKLAAEHGIGKHKRSHFLAQVDPLELELMRSIKHILDPYNLLNPQSSYAY